MKVLLVTAYGSLMTTEKASWIRPVVRYLPCDLVECYSTLDVRNHLVSADVILLDSGPRFIPYWEELTFLNKSSVFIGYYPLDPWYPQKLDGVIRSDVYLVSSLEIMRKYRPQVKHLFWLPPSVDTQDYLPPRDIDVLFWGTVNYPSKTSYPFRSFVVKKLRSCAVGESVEVDPFLSIRDIDVEGCKGRYGFVKSTPGMFSWNPSAKQFTYGYYGSKLFRLLSRARMCVAGSKMPPGIPLGKYFENATCGVVTLSNSFAEMEDLGFKHGEHIWITDKDCFLRDLTYLLEHPSLVEEMSRNAKELVGKKHTREVRSRELYKFLCKRTGKA